MKRISIGRHPLRETLCEIAMEAHMDGRVYNKMGEPDNPATAYVKMVDKAIRTFNRRHPKATPLEPLRWSN